MVAFFPVGYGSVKVCLVRKSFRSPANEKLMVSSKMSKEVRGPKKTQIRSSCQVGSEGTEKCDCLTLRDRVFNFVLQYRLIVTESGE